MPGRVRAAPLTGYSEEVWLLCLGITNYDKANDEPVKLAVFDMATQTVRSDIPDTPGIPAGKINSNKESQKYFILYLKRPSQTHTGGPVIFSAGGQTGNNSKVLDRPVKAN